MTGMLTSSAAWTGAVIAVAVAMGLARLWLWRRRAPDGQPKAPAWRLPALAALQIAAGLALYFTLHPPSVAVGPAVLHVATSPDVSNIARGPGDPLVALPEAGRIAGADRAPDLATALRRHPQARRVQAHGQGLTPRDRIPLPIPLDFDAPPPPRGVVELSTPRPTAPGGVIRIGGRVGTLPSGVVELIDPSGAVVDQAAVAAGDRFQLTADARAAGLALFTLRLRDTASELMEDIPVPVEVREQPQPRVLILAGAPNAEIKYLRRWAEDAGIDLGVSIDLGAGTQLQGSAPAVTRAALAEVDLLVADDRRWDALGPSARGAVRDAVAGGMGLLLRPTGPLSAATRRDWNALGVPFVGGDDARPVQLSAAPGADPEDGLELTRRNLALREDQAIALIRDAGGEVLAAWAERGRGRIGVWTVTDSFALVLTGEDDRHGELWSALFSTLSRALDDPRPRVDGPGWAGTRLSVCGLGNEGSALDPRGQTARLIVDPATGDRACAAYWPRQGGWHTARDEEGRETPFYVLDADAAPSLRQADRRQATLAMADAAPASAAAESRQAPGSPWPWFLALLAALTLLWWLERRRPIPAA